MTTCIVFVCHNQESINHVSDHLIHEDVYILLVGNHLSVNPHPRLIVACQQPHHIEMEDKLLTFTAWYAIVKNNLLSQYEYYCILEYDCTVSDMVWLKDQLTMNQWDVVSFVVTNRFFLTDVNPDIFYKFLKSKHIYTTYSSDIGWGCTTNHCIRKKVLRGFVDWYFPYCLYFKIADYYNYSYYHERLFAVYVSHHNIPFAFLLHPNVQHESVTSHSITRNIPVYDFDWEYYLKKNPDVLEACPNMNPRTVSILHFTEYGYKEKRMYKPSPKKYFLLYDDETGRYDSNLKPLIESIKEYSEYDIIIFKESEIDTEFLKKNKSIFALSRGGGYWLWKPYIIRETLKRIEPGSILFYIDSSYRFLATFDELTQYVDKNDVMIWKNKPNEPVYPMKEWCKKDVLDMYKTPGDMEICWAGAMILKNTLYTRCIVDEWLQSCTYQNITDAPSLVPNSHEFIEHRHDQALLSTVLFRYNVPLHFMPTDFLHNNRMPFKKLDEFNHNNV